MKKNPCGEPGGKRTGKPAGKRPWRDGAMTDTVMDQIERGLSALARGGGDAGLRRALEDEGFAGGVATSTLGVAQCCAGAPRSAWTDAVLGVLLARAASDEAASMALVVALSVDLRAMAGRLEHSGLERDDARSVVVLAALDVAASAALEPSAGLRRRIVAEVWNRCRTVARREQRRRSIEGAAYRPRGDDVPDCPSEECSDLLAWAVDHGVVSEEEARIVGATRVEGVSVARLAGLWGVSAGSLTSKRRRAESRLRGALAGGGRG